MRSSLSCDFCRCVYPDFPRIANSSEGTHPQERRLRKSKIKCVNSGTPPCQKCQKSEISGCVLTRPQQVPSRVSRRRGTAAQPRRSRDIKRHKEQSTLLPSSPRQESTVESPLGDTESACDTSQIDAHLASLPTGVILKSLNVFTNKFPELGILHLQTLMQAFQSECSKETKALLGAILLVTNAQMSLFNPAWTDCLLPGKNYEIYTRQILAELIIGPPNIQVVQALLIMTLYEWGSRNFHKAWVYCGKSRRKGSVEITETSEFS
jgi:hypothetical protein